MVTSNIKKQIGIRIPRELDERLENHVKKIGISKPAFILGLIYKELKKEESDTRTPPEQAVSNRRYK